MEDPVEYLSAVTLVVADVPGSVTFYRTLGFHTIEAASTDSFASLRVGGGFLNLQQGEPPPPDRPVWGRVIFWVDDVDAMYRRAVEAGFSPESEPVDAPWGERYFHLRDPDGHELSFARPFLA